MAILISLISFEKVIKIQHFYKLEKISISQK